MPSIMEAQAESLTVSDNKFEALIIALKGKIRQTLCSLTGGHDLHKAHSDSRIYQKCLCGYETPGWTIDRRDRQR